MKKITKKIMAAMSAAVMCAVPMMNSLSANAATNQKKTYMIYSVAITPNMAYFDFTLNYSSDVTASKGIATNLCNNGYFSSSNNTSSRKVLHTYNGPAIGATGDLCKTKFITPMNTDSVFDVVSLSDVKIRNANGTTLAPTSINLEAILMGDVDLNGVVNNNDSQLIMNFIGNRDNYPLTARQRAAADVYENGSGVTAKDALEIQRYVAGLVDHF